MPVSRIEEASKSFLQGGRTGFSPHATDAPPDILGRYRRGVVVAGHIAQPGARTDRSE
jgi:hypothetical protein